MLSRVTIAILILSSALIESTIFPFPLVVLFSILFFLFFDELQTLTIVFLASILLDSFLLNNLGHTALFLFPFFCLLLLLEKIFTYKFSPMLVAVLTFLGVEAYRQYASYPFIFGVEAVLILSLLLFVVIEKRIARAGRRTNEAKTA